MPKTHVSRSTIINAAADKVFPAIADLSHWQAWSPWLICEPEAKVTVTNDGKAYSWDGNRTGAGGMVITDRVENTSARYDLTFLKPFKSTAKVGMELKNVSGGTEVTWTMDSQLPFFMFWMKNMMQTYIGMDYERGLRLLKDYVEDGEVHSKINFIGENQYAGCNFVGVKRDCTTADMPALMKSDFENLMSWASINNLNPEDSFSIYHDFNPLKGKCSYTAAVKYSETPASIPPEYYLGSHAPNKLQTVEHIGPYEHLGNAWSAAHMMIRNKEFKPVKNYHPFETYGNSPMDTPPNELITRINFAVQ